MPFINFYPFCFSSSLFLSFDIWICEFCFWESDRCQWSLPKDERESARDLGKSANLVVVLPDLPTTAGAMVLLYLKTEQIHVCEVINKKKWITFLDVFLSQIVVTFFFCEVRIWRRMRIKHKRPKLCKAQASHKSFASSPTRVSKKSTSLEWPYMAIK